VTGKNQVGKQTLKVMVVVMVVGSAAAFIVCFLSYLLIHCNHC